MNINTAVVRLGCEVVLDGPREVFPPHASSNLPLKEEMESLLPLLVKEYFFTL